MKKWMKFEEYLISGEWHVHTSYTDGANTVLQLVAAAEKLKIPLIAFTEHVRRDLTYDFNDFLSDIEKAREEFPDVIVLSGIEAKVLPDGSLDVDKEILSAVDHAIFAFHSFKGSADEFLQSLKKVIKNDEISAWAHPMPYSTERPSNSELGEIFQLMEKNCVLLEINSKYSAPPKSWIDLAKKMGVKFVRGSDVHKISDLKRVKFDCGEEIYTFLEHLNPL